MKQWRWSTLLVWPFLAGAALALGPPQAYLTDGGEQGCANLSVIDCDDCEEESSEDTVQQSTPASWVSLTTSASEFCSYGNETEGGTVHANLEYYHAVHDYAVCYGGQSCESCGDPSATPGINFSIEETFTLRHERIFRSRIWKSADGHGRRWTHNHDIQLGIQPGPGYVTALLTFPSGITWRWIDVGGTGVFVEQGSLHKETTKATLEVVPAGYLVTTKFGERIQLVAMADDPVVDYRPAWMESKNGFRLTYTYDAIPDGIDRLVQVTDSFGRSLTYEWGKLGASMHVITKLTVPDGREVLYSHTGPDEFTVTHPNGDVSSFARKSDPVDGPYYEFNDAIGNAGSRKHRVYTRPSGQTRLIKDIDGNVLYRSTWINPNTIQWEDALGAIKTYKITDTGYPIALTEQCTGATRTTDWDQLNFLVTERADYLGNKTQYAYEDNQLTGITNPDGSVVAMTYSGALRTGYIDELGRQHSYEYDAQGNLIKHVYPDGTFEAWTVNGFGQQVGFTDRNGRVTTAAYDAFGNLVQLVLPDDDAVPGNEPTWQFTCDINGRRLSAIDPEGRATHYTYDALDRVTVVTYADGTTEETVYGTGGSDPVDPAGLTGLVVSSKDRNGDWTAFTYDRLDNQLAVIDPLGTVVERTYVPGTDLVASEDREGDLTWFTYCTMGRLMSKSVAADAVEVLTTTYEYDDLGRLVKQTDPYGFERAWIHDALGRVVQDKVESGDGVFETTTYGHDAVGNRTSRTDPLGNVWLTEYDVNDRVSRTVDPLGGEVLFTYDPVGNLLTRSERIESGRYATTTWTWSARDMELSETDGTGVVVEKTYHLDDQLATIAKPATGGLQTLQYACCGRLLSRTILVDGGANDMTESYVYDGNGNVVELTDGEGHVWLTSYDERDRLLDRTDPRGEVSRMRYVADGSSIVTTLDPGQGRATFTTDANGNTTTEVLDGAGRRIALVDPTGASTIWCHGLCLPGQIGIHETDRAGVQTWQWFDGVGRLVREVDALGGTTWFFYDLAGSLVRVVDANGSATEYAYDAVGRLTLETYADGGKVHLTWYDNGWLRSRTDQELATMVKVVDDAGRLLEVVYPDASKDLFGYDAGGRLTSATTGLYPTGFPTLRAYDPADRLVAETQLGKTVTYGYDRRSLKTRTTLPGGIPILRAYSNRGELAAVEALGKHFLGQSYDAGGRLATKRLNDSLLLTGFAYDVRDRLVGITHTKGTTDLGSLAYAYDPEGNKLQEQDLTFPTRSQTFAYDAAYRLVDWERGPLGGPPIDTQTWDLDPLANWNSTTIGGLLTTCLHNMVNELVQQGAMALDYDANGNLIADDTFTYLWDWNGRLREVRLVADGSLVARYAYDAFGRRVARIDMVTPEQRFYLYEGEQVLQEYTLGLKHVATNLYGNFVDEPVARVSGETYYYMTNGLYSPMVLTDALGNVVERYEYDAYGEATTYDGLWLNPLDASRVGNPFLFTGRRLDPETDLLHFRARMFAPDQGRFVGRDPSGYVDGWNLYRAYFVPNGTDPTGMACWYPTGFADGAGGIWPRNIVVAEYFCPSEGSVWIQWDIPEGGSSGCPAEWTRLGDETQMVEFECAQAADTPFTPMVPSPSVAFETCTLECCTWCPPSASCDGKPPTEVVPYPYLNPEVPVRPMWPFKI